MILEWGMSEKLGFVNLRGVPTAREVFIPEKEYSDDTARLIDEEVATASSTPPTARPTELVRRALGSRWSAVAEALLKYETLTRARTIARIMRGERMEKPTVAELLLQEAARQTPPKPKTAFAPR